jgi:DUF3096 family protein
MRLSAVAHQVLPFAALGSGILVLLMPRLLNYGVAIYLILVGRNRAQQHLSFHPLTSARRRLRQWRGGPIAVAKLS